MSYEITKRELRSDEIAICPYDDNIYVVIRIDRMDSIGRQLYKVQLWNKETNSYGETSYALPYYKARIRFAIKLGM